VTVVGFHSFQMPTFELQFPAAEIAPSQADLAMPTTPHAMPHELPLPVRSNLAAVQEELGRGNAPGTG
jgi:hypothetical protein